MILFACGFQARKHYKLMRSEGANLEIFRYMAKKNVWSVTYHTYFDGGSS